jgi:hypothetical protein
MNNTTHIPTTAIASNVAKRIVATFPDVVGSFTIRAHQPTRNNIGSTHHVGSHELVLHFMRQHSGATMYTFHIDNNDVTSMVVGMLSTALLASQQQSPSNNA